MHRSNEPARAGGTSFVRESGAEIGAQLWETRRIGLADRENVEAALAWSRARAEALAGGLRSPLAVVASLACESGAQNPIGGMLERASRDLRFARSALDPSTSLGSAAASPKDGLDTLDELERVLEAMAKLVYLEQDAVVLALHAAAHGEVPGALESPGAWGSEEPKGAVRALERAAEALGADRLDVEAASAALRALGCLSDDTPPSSVAEMLVAVMKVRGRLEGEAPPSNEAIELASRAAAGDDEGNAGGGGSAPPSAPPVAPEAPPVPVTMAPPTLGSAPWCGALPPRRAFRRRSRPRVLPSRARAPESIVAPASNLRRKGAA
jgi:hypothetical protein